MNTALRSKLKAKLPEYHSQPLKLTLDEIADPQMVISEFFDRYHLPDIRVCLREWLDESIREDEVLPMNFLALHDEVMRLVEAVWVMNEGK